MDKRKTSKNNVNPLAIYFSSIESIKKTLQLEDGARLSELLDLIDNYLEQFKCVSTSEFFSANPKLNLNGAPNILSELMAFELDSNDLKNRTLYKINQSLNEKLTLFQDVL
jgi:hypothetical protein